MHLEQLFYTLPLRLRSLFRHKQVELELDEELQYHLDQKIEEGIAQGLTPDQARFAALRAMQGIEQRKEECRDTQHVAGIQNLLQDIRFGIRMLKSAPAFTAATVLTLALGIGANTAIYSVVKAVLIRQLPYTDPERIVQLIEHSPPWAIGQDWPSVEAPPFLIWRQAHNIFKDVAAAQYDTIGVNLRVSDSTEQIAAHRVSAEYFRLYGAPLELGRTFSPDEDSAGGPQVAVISYRLWHRRFGGDPGVIGKMIVLRGQPTPVIGVIGEGFLPDPSPEVWIPLQANADGTNIQVQLRVVARLQPGVTLQQVRNQVKLAKQECVRRLPKLFLASPQLAYSANILRDVVVGDIRTALLIAAGAAGMVLMIACANVANLLLVRAASRRREFAIRAALGGSRLRIVIQLFIEYLILALAGGLVGVPLGYLGLRALIASSPGNIPRVNADGSGIALDWQMLLLALFITLLTGLVFGLLPALQASRSALTARLSETSTRTSPGAGQRKSRSLLIVVEMALAVILLAGAALLIRTLSALVVTDPGFDAKNVLVLEMSLNGSPFNTTTKIAGLIQEVERRVESLPGVTALAATASVPFVRHLGGVLAKADDPDARSGADACVVSRKYFDVFRIPLRRGRIFAEMDTLKAAPVILINEKMARGGGESVVAHSGIVWKNGEPQGQRIEMFKDMGLPWNDPTRQIVGVVGDTREWAQNQAPKSTVYIPLAQISDEFSTSVFTNGSFFWVVRTISDPAAYSSAIDREIRNASGGLPLAHINTMTQMLTDSTARQQFNMMLSTIFAAIAVLLAATGLYGVMSYSVEERTKEIGIRIALGAPQRQVRRRLVFEGMRLALIGVILGSLGSLLLTPFMRSLLYGVEPTDPALLAAAAVFLTLVALIATYIPARRATTIDPLQALRWE